jgi:hypothetical protein
VPQYDARTAGAARERDSGVRKVSRLTWRCGLVGVACSAILTGALAHHGDAGAATAPAHHQSSGIVIPATPPQPASGSGQVNSGAS